MIDYTLINSNEALKNKCRYFAENKKIAMDIEADSMHHFKEKICLIQAADLADNYIIDPLTIDDFSPLKPVCENADIIKIFHGSDFDIRSLDRDFGIKVKNLFDTEIACRFLGIQRRSLAALLKKYFNLNIDKSFQKTDWSKRPLSDKMILYSISDVAYLIELAEILEKKLADSGRLSWAMEEFELQSRVCYEKNDSTPLFMKFKGAGKMRRENLAVLESLLQMRLSIAKQKNVPLFKIIGSEAITKLADKKPKTMQELKQSNALSDKQIEMYGNRWLKAVVEALSLSKDKMPCYPKKEMQQIQSSVPERVVNALKNLRESISRKTGIEPGFLINNATIALIATLRPSSDDEILKINGTRKWQVEILGRDIVRLLN